MLYLYHSNDLELLKGLLEHKLQESPLGPFEKEQILVQNQGMTQWLKLQLASGLGIAAQVDFPLPSKFIWEVFNTLNPNLPKRTYFDKQIMAWKLMDLLPSLISEPEYAPIRAYLTEPNASTAQPSQADSIDLLKCYQLARTIADVFDQYLIYRPEWLLAWEQGDNQAEGEELGVHAWQPLLWRALVASMPEVLADGSLPREHRGRVHLELNQLIENNAQALQHLPKRLFVFGIATLPKVYWEALLAISSEIEVHFYLHNPCNEFWSDIVNSRQYLKNLHKREGLLHLEVGNPLLASWGKLGREFLSYVQTAERPVQEFELFYDETDELTENRNLLKQLQYDILSLTDATEGAFKPEALLNSEFKREVAPEDGSVRLINGHSPLRELQRLYDQILYWLETDPSLKPRDIVVMVPDINQYAPYIDAVFGSHKAEQVGGGTYRIPWAIADQSIAQENPILESFLALLNLPESRFVNTEVMDLLSVPAIARRFELSESELELVHKWVAEAQIRWGLDGKQRAEVLAQVQGKQVPVFEQNSWRQGLKQILLGAMLPNQAVETGFADDFPVFTVEGHGTETLGKLIEFIDQLELYAKRLKITGLDIPAWGQLIYELLDTFYEPEEDENYTLQMIRDSVEALEEDTELAEFTGELPTLVVRSWFDERLGNQAGWQRFLSGPVNFCSLMPMRSIPFKAVCMLGMNDTDYPRKSPVMGFDLMQKFPKKGDRAKREDDRYLFLEAICSAQKYLYISYRGHDVRENSEQQPSVLVAELRDYLGESFCLAGEQHLPHAKSQASFLKWFEEALPLQPYNRLSFKPEHPRAVPSYHQMWAKVVQAELLAAKQQREQQTLAQTEQQQELSDLDIQNWPVQPLPFPEDMTRAHAQLADVTEALKNSARFFVQRRLQTKLENSWEDIETESHEPFEVSNLQAHIIKADYFNRVRAGAFAHRSLEAEWARFTQQQQALGQVPVNQFGALTSQDWVREIELLANTPFLQNAQPLPNQSISLSLAQEEGSGEQTLLQGERHHAYKLPETDEQVLIYSRVGSIRGAHLLEAWLQLLLVSLHDASFQKAYYFGLERQALVGYELTAPGAEQSKALLQLALSWYWRSWCAPVPHFPNILWDIFQEFRKIEQNEKIKEADWPEKKQIAVFNAFEGSGGTQKFGDAHDLYAKRCLANDLAILPSNYQAWLETFGTVMNSLHIQTRQLREEELEQATEQGVEL